jgi:DNA polymerase-4
MEYPRKIIHIDMDAFFASVEQRDNPHLIGKPIAVGGSQYRGVVAAASYEARKYGVRSAMPSQRAVQLCPDLIFVKSRFERYKKVSSQINTIFKKYTNLVEPLSLDEAYLDITKLPIGFNSATEVAEKIRQDIFEATNLTASAGVSFNKFLAKMASDVNKPDGIFVLTPKKAQDFLCKLEIRKFYGIGKVTAYKFQKMGILYGSDLLRLSLSYLEQHFGKSAKSYYNLARGIDKRLVKVHRERKSIGAERTFSSDIDNLEDLLPHLTFIVKTVAERCQKIGKKGRTVTVKIKYSDFTQITRGVTTNDYKFSENKILSQTKKLLSNIDDFGRGVRLIGVTISNLENGKKNTKQLKLEF